MAELVALGLEVMEIPPVRRYLDRNPLDDLEPVRAEPDDLARVVREKPDLAEAEVRQDLRADAVIAEIGGEAELDVRLDRIPVPNPGARTRGPC